MRADNCLRAEVLLVVPEHRARGGACRTQDALRGVVEDRAIFSGLVALLGGRVAFGDEERHDLAVGLEERLHVDDEVLLLWETLDRFDGDGLLRVEVFDQGLAGKAVAPVDAHRIGAADAVSARATERE